jgi:hypothetical protein
LYFAEKEIIRSFWGSVCFKAHPWSLFLYNPLTVFFSVVQKNGGFSGSESEVDLPEVEQIRTPTPEIAKVGALLSLLSISSLLRISCSNMHGVLLQY